MGKATRKRWDGNVRSMAIIAKDPADITPEDLTFLRKNYTSMGGLVPGAYSGGAFFTPTHVARFIVEALRGLSGGEFPKGARFLEPSCGSGVFLEHIPEDAEITALEIDPTSAKVASLLYPRANIIQADAFTHERRDYYDYVIGNPPFGVTIDIPADLCEDFVTLRKAKNRSTGEARRKGKSEFAFIELAIKAARPGGYIALILPMGVGFAQQGRAVRELLYETCWHVATIHLPPETFQHVGTNVPTQILIVRKAPPNTPLIEATEKRWGSNFKRGGYEDITDFNARYLAGQMPSFFAVITDIGYDKDGKPSADVLRWNDGMTQLDVVLEAFTDDNLIRENLYPHIPSWHDSRDVTHYMFTHGNGSCDGYRDASGTYGYDTEPTKDGPYMWNELTLGVGREVICPILNIEVSTMDFTWQDEIVRKYYEDGGW